MTSLPVVNNATLNAVSERYSAAAVELEPALCCPVNYDPRLLKVLPIEILERDYGCGDPSRYVTRGDAVLDLGSGGGKICYIASQLVGPEGRVIGVDMNDDMLGLARRYQPEIAQRIGWSNVTFCKGKIQDLSTNLEATEAQHQPLIASDSMDVVLSNCVLNLVDENQRQQLFAEVFRVLRPGGRAIISDIVSNLPVPAELRADPQLWSGCISGAFEEGEFLQSFAAAGFCAVELLERQTAPWQVHQGIEFRSATIRATKPLAIIENDAPVVVMYRGPFASVTDETGTTFQRGQKVTVRGESLQRLASSPYAGDFVWTSPAWLHLNRMSKSAETPGKCC